MDDRVAIMDHDPSVARMRDQVLRQSGVKIDIDALPILERYSLLGVLMTAEKLGVVVEVEETSVTARWGSGDGGYGVAVFVPPEMGSHADALAAAIARVSKKRDELLKAEGIARLMRGLGMSVHSGNGWVEILWHDDEFASDFLEGSQPRARWAGDDYPRALHGAANMAITQLKVSARSYRYWYHRLKAKYWDKHDEETLDD